MFRSCQPRFIFCTETEEVQKTLAVLGTEATLICFEDNAEFTTFQQLLKTVDIYKYEAVAVKNPKQQLALIVCSSGSTGMPKGVGLTHANLTFQIDALE